MTKSSTTRYYKDTHEQFVLSQKDTRFLPRDPHRNGMDEHNAKSINWRQGTNQTREYIEPISKTFEVLDATEGCPKPFYIYRYNIRKVRDNSELKHEHADSSSNEDAGKFSVRVRRLVLMQAITSWLDDNQPEDDYYFVGPVLNRLLTQFAFQGSEFTDDQDEEGCKLDSCFKQQVTIKNPQLVDSEFVPVDETYIICFSTWNPPIMDLTREADNREVCRAIESMILADIEADETFASTRSNQVYKLTVAEGERGAVINLRPHLKMIIGLKINIMQFPSRRVEGEISTLLKIYESWNLFLEPVNMIKLLQEYFEFDISGPLEREQIERVKCELQWQTVEMRVESSASDNGDQDPDKPEVENYVTCIKDVSLKTVAEEPCEFSDQLREFAPAGEITVERQFRREFPGIELEYTHLPCLISPKGRKMPIEVCWIRPGRPLERRPTPPEMRDLNRMTHNARLRIFEENCRELIRDYGSTLGKFGFKLWPA